MAGGIIPSILTPFDDGGQIDGFALRGEVGHLVEMVAIHGIAVAGNTGEGHTLSDEEIFRLASWTVAEVAGRILTKSEGGTS